MPAHSTPRLAFTARDVQDLIEEINKVSKGVHIGITHSPKPSDPARLALSAAATRKGYQIGTPPVAKVQVYVPGKGQHYLDKALADLLWMLLQDLEAPVALWGRYTSLTQ
jgi:hypothetical protein